MADEKMSLIEELQNPPRLDGGGLDEGRVVDLMRVGAFALSTEIGVASKAAGELGRCHDLRAKLEVQSMQEMDKLRAQIRALGAEPAL